MGDTSSKEPAVLFVPDESAAQDCDEKRVVKVIDIDPAILELCDAVRLKHSDIKWTLFKITDQQTITIDSTLECNAFDEDFQNDRDSFSSMVNALEVDKPRYIVYKFSIPTTEGESKHHLAFIYWCDENCATRDKTMYDSSKDAIAEKLGEEITKFRATSKTDFDYDKFAHKLSD